MPDPDDPERMILKIEQLDDMSFVIYTGEDGDPEQPVSWRNFPHALTGQWGLIASPFWLAEVADEPRAGHPAGRLGPVHRRQLRAPRLARGQPQPRLLDDRRRRQPAAVPRLDHVPRDRGLGDRRRGARRPATSTSSRRRTAGRSRRSRSLGDEFDVAPPGRATSRPATCCIDLDKPGPLQDRRVRCAMSMAIDRDELNDVTNDGLQRGRQRPVLARAAGLPRGQRRCRSSRTSTPPRR